MLKWLLTLALVVLISGIVQPGPSNRFRLGHLPGDVNLRIRGRLFQFPFTSTLLLSFLAWLLLRNI